jgi:hypothetical protein
MTLCQGIDCRLKTTCQCYLEYVREFNNQERYPLLGGGPWAAHKLCRVDPSWYIHAEDIDRPEPDVS